MPEVLLHFDVNGGSLCAKSYSFDYIDFLSFLRNTTKGDILLMLTITDLIAVISLCATFYSLGYVRGKHDAKTQK